MIADKKIFMFDRSFDEEEPDSETAVEEQADIEEEVLEEIAPTFSEEDLAAAREESFDLGREEGVKQALEGIETRIAESLGTIEGKLTELFQIQSEENERIERESVTLSKEMVLKLFPLLNQSAGFDHISHMASEVLGNLIKESRVIVRVNDQLGEILRERLESSLLDRGFEGILTVLGDAQIAHGDCQIEWSNGSTDRNMSNLLESIDQIIERNANFFGNTVEESGSMDASAETRDSVEQPVSPLEAETSSGVTAEALDQEPENTIANSGTDSENSVSPELPDLEEQS